MEIDEVHSTEVSTAESNYELSCAGGSSSSSITYVNRQNEGSITAEDEVAIGEEHFYVVSSDNTNTVLLAKYDLKSDGNGSYMQDTSGTNTDIVKVNFLDNNNTAYWDNGNCTYNNGWSCPGTAGLKSEYANASHAAGSTSYASSIYPYVYNSTMSSTAPSYGTYTSGSNTWRAAQDNGYTVAYYVEEYVNTLKGLGAPNNIEGRLLTYEEANTLSGTVKGNWSYWLGSVSNYYGVRHVYGGSIINSSFWIDSYIGVRPVIVVSTSEV